MLPPEVKSYGVKWMYHAHIKKSLTTGKADGMIDCDLLKVVYSTDALTAFRWSTT